MVVRIIKQCCIVAFGPPNVPVKRFLFVPAGDVEFGVPEAEDVSSQRRMVVCVVFKAVEK